MIKAHGLKCDKDGCDYRDDSTPYEEYKNCIGKECPLCGSNLLTLEDFNSLELMNTLGEAIDKGVVTIPVGVVTPEALFKWMKDESIVDKLNKLD